MSYYARPSPAGMENMGKPWKQEEIEQLLTEIKDKKDISEIASTHKRTPGGITSRLREIACNLHILEGKSLSEISDITGLDTSDISESINRRRRIHNDNLVKQLKKSENNKLQAKPDSITIELPQSKDILDLRKDVNELKKDVKEILRLMNALYDFETSQS
jgi:hypothetical protein